MSRWLRTGLHAAGAVLTVVSLASGCRAEQPAPAARAASTPRRIVTFAPSSTEIIAAIGAADRLVAVGSFCTYPPEVAKLPKVGGQFDPNLEGILRLRPDLVVIRGGNHEVEALCERNGIRVFKDPTDSLDDLYATIRALGDLLDRRDAAAAAAAKLRGELDRTAAAVSRLKRPRVFFAVSRRDPGTLSGILTASQGTFVDEMITLAGGTNVFAGLAMAYPEVSPEAVLAARPDVIVEAMPEARGGPDFEQQVREAWRRLGPVPAVADDRIFLLTDENTLVPSPRMVSTVAKLARLLHPEARLD